MERAARAILRYQDRGRGEFRGRSALDVVEEALPGDADLGDVLRVARRAVHRARKLRGEALDVSTGTAGTLLERARDEGWIEDVAGGDEQGYRWALTDRVEARCGGVDEPPQHPLLGGKISP